MDHIIDNLGTRNMTSYTAIEPKMLDIADKHVVDLTNGDTAYYTSTAGKKGKQTRPAGQRRPSENRSITPGASNTSSNVCTWCKKHNLTFVGHVYTNYSKLKEYQDRRKKQQPSAKVANTDERDVHYISDDDDNTNASPLTGFMAGSSLHVDTTSRSSTGPSRSCTHSLGPLHHQP